MYAQKVRESSKFIRDTFLLKEDEKIDVAVVLGSGLGEFVNRFSDKKIIEYKKIPHFVSSTISGHAGNLILVRIKGKLILIMQGRFHYYEGYDLSIVTYPIRVFGSMGCKKIIFTNAAGSINNQNKPGTFMIIKDHINFMGNNPLIGKNEPEFGPRFIDMSFAYNKDFRKMTKKISKRLGIDIFEGVYLATSGPSYETPAEISMYKTIGADAVGMSTVPEVIVAKHMGMEVLGVSCITNLAAGVSNEKLSHEEVKEIAKLIGPQFSELLFNILEEI